MPSSLGWAPSQQLYLLSLGCVSCQFLGWHRSGRGDLELPEGTTLGPSPAGSPQRLPLLRAAVTSTCSCGLPPRPEVTLLTWWW